MLYSLGVWVYNINESIIKSVEILDKVNIKLFHEFSRSCPHCSNEDLKL